MAAMSTCLTREQQMRRIQVEGRLIEQTAEKRVDALNGCNGAEVGGGGEEERCSARLMPQRRD